MVYASGGNAARSFDAAIGRIDLRTVTVIIPTLNEAPVIGALIAELAVRYPGLRVLVVDDSSADGTGAIVKQMASSVTCRNRIAVELLERRGASGLTGSVVEGMRRIKTEYFIVMDGDLQHPPAALGALLEKLADGAELAVGSRLPYRENQGIHRILITKLSRSLARRHLERRGISVSDPMSGLFAGKTSLILRILRDAGDRFEPKGYKILFDLLRTGPLGLRVAEVPYQFGLRSQGDSKLRAEHAFFFLRSLFR